MPAPAKVLELVERFERFRGDYKSGQYKVERMLDLHRRLAAAKGEAEKTSLSRLAASTDAEIDRLVYELYGLTEEENQDRRGW